MHGVPGTAGDGGGGELNAVLLDVAGPFFRMRGVMRNCVLLCLLPLFIGVVAGAELNPADVRAAATYSANRQGASILVIQHGRTLIEEYPGGGSASGGRKIFSGTKAFWNLAALAAAEDGVLSLDERVAVTIPAWRDDPRKSRVTIRQLLDFSCGLDPGFFLHGDDPGNQVPHGWIE